MLRYDVLIWTEDIDGGFYDFDSSYHLIDLAEQRAEQLSIRGYEVKIKEVEGMEEL